MAWDMPQQDSFSVSSLSLLHAAVRLRAVNRIDARFEKLFRDGKKGFIVYIGAGDPTLRATHDLALAFDGAGVDILEIGVPFSDPLADGLVNQLAAQRGLASGTTPTKVLDTVKQIRRQSQIPIVLYIYFNLIHRRGLDAFIQFAAKAGVDGLLVLDLPPEEGGDYDRLMREQGLCAIYLVAPTTPDSRIKEVVRNGTGFVYYVSREGVTGMQSKVSDTIAERVKSIRAYTKLPIAVGFGISNAQQAKMVGLSADAVVVGSAVVNQIAAAGNSPDLSAKVVDFVRPLIAAVKS